MYLYLCTHTQVLNPLKELARDITTERRKHLATGSDLNRQLKNQLDLLDRVRERGRFDKKGREREQRGRGEGGGGRERE